MTAPATVSVERAGGASRVAAYLLFAEGVVLAVGGALAAVAALIVLVGLSIADLDSLLLLAVVAASLLLLGRHQIRLARGLLAGEAEAVSGTVNLQWLYLGLGALFAFWTFVIAEHAYVFPLFGVILPIAVLVLVGVAGGRIRPEGGGGGSLSGGKSEPWRWSSRSDRREALTALAFLAPAFIVFGWFFFWPLNRILHFAIYQQNRTGTAERYVGFSQITDTLSGADFRDGLLHTLTYVLFTVPAGLVLGILLAVVANRKLRGIKIFQTIFSSTVATSVAVASVIFYVLLNPQIGYLKVDWLSNPNEVLFGVSLSSIWQNLGLTFIIVLAGLQAVPEELMESATVDGAGPIRRFFNVTLPLISPTLLFLIVVLTVFAFQAFAQIDILTAGGPAGASETLVFKIFQSQQPTDLGEGSAMALGLFGITFLVTMGQFLILDRRVHYG